MRIGQEVAVLTAAIIIVVVFWLVVIWAIFHGVFDRREAVDNCRAAAICPVSKLLAIDHDPKT